MQRAVLPEIRALSPALADALGAFFEDCVNSGADRHFHPHPLTREQATKLCNHTGKDLYYAFVEGDRVLAYGMLRGWDEGFEVPSLGIAVAQSERRSGLARTLMSFLHTAARRRHAKRIRLKTYRSNHAAMQLYESLGYQFDEAGKDELVGFLALGSDASPDR
jgi:ribosomal protein S18 acetylase RimI-like enzyme